MNVYEQSNSTYFNVLVQLVKEHPKSYFNFLKSKKFRLVFDWINDIIPLLSDSKYKFSTKCNWILNGRTVFPVCEMCNATFGQNMNLNANAYYSHVCPRCAAKVAAKSTKQKLKDLVEADPHYYDKIVEKRKKTNEILHADPNYNNMEKNKSTCIHKYGVDNSRKSRQCKDTIKRTKKARHGDENWNNMEKFKSTCIANHGVEWPMQSAEIRSKSATKYEHDGFQFNSKQELCFYVWLRDHKIDFNINSSIKLPYMYKGKQHWYIPDFIVEGQVVEIKGDHFFKEDGTMQNPYDNSQGGLYEAKHQCMIENNVTIILQSECDEYIKYVNAKY